MKSDTLSKSQSYNINSLFFKPLPRTEIVQSATAQKVQVGMCNVSEHASEINNWAQWCIQKQLDLNTAHLKRESGVHKAGERQSSVCMFLQMLQRCSRLLLSEPFYK